MSESTGDPGRRPAARWREWLTRRELIVLGEVLAIVAFAIVLLLARVAFSVPSERFIYGRF